MICNKFSHISFVWVLVLLVMLSACQNEVDIPMVDIPVSLTIPVRENTISKKMPAEFADPGTTEVFDFPEYAYIYIVCETSLGTSVSSTVDFHLDADKWVKEEYTGQLSTSGDPIYRYTGNLTLGLPKENRTAGRVYAALSKTPLTLSATPTTETEIQNLQFELTTAMQENLKNVYSSPYNYMVEGEYYGTINNITSKVPSVNIMLYHVASKVDLMWNVPAEMQSKMKVKGLKVKNLYHGQCYLFRPTENEYAAEKLTSGYEIELATNSAGTWWQGREYIYTIPYKNNESTQRFPLQMEFAIEDTELATDQTYNLTIKKSMNGVQTDVFVPWIRTQMTFTSVKSGEETKEID